MDTLAGLHDKGWISPITTPLRPGLYKRLLETANETGTKVEIGFWDGRRWYSMRDGTQVENNRPWASILGYGAIPIQPMPRQRM